MSGATEHVRADEWTAALAYANIGLAGAAIRSRKWLNAHRPRLLEIFVALLTSPESVIGLLLNGSRQPERPFRVS